MTTHCVRSAFSRRVSLTQFWKDSRWRPKAALQWPRARKKELKAVCPHRPSLTSRSLISLSPRRKRHILNLKRRPKKIKRSFRKSRSRRKRRQRSRPRKQKTLLRKQQQAKIFFNLRA